MSASYTYTFPRPGRALGSRALGIVTDGWQLSGITRITTGGPFTPTWTFISGQTNVTGTPTQNARISVLDPNAPPLERFRPPERGYVRDRRPRRSAPARHAQLGYVALSHH